MAAKQWVYKHENYTIKVVNDFNGCELYVNGELRDKKNGITLNDNMTTKLDSGENVKVSLGGTLSVKCSLFIDDVLQSPIKD